MTPILSKPVRITGKTEITRSFTYKLNAGNYESRDFFCSQKVECQIEDATEVSKLVHQFCKREVMRAVEDYAKENGFRNERKAS